MRDLILFPFGGNAREAVAWNLVGFVDDNPALAGSAFGGHDVLGGREVLSRHPEAMILAVPGRPDTFRRRGEVIGGLGLATDRFATIVHPRANIGTGVEIGNQHTHPCRRGADRQRTHRESLRDLAKRGDLARHGRRRLVHGWTSVAIAGGVHVEANCYIGSGSRIIHDITVGKGSLVGLGAVVIQSTSPGATLVGNPARSLER